MKRFIITILLLAFAGLSFGAENLPAIIPLPRKVVCKGKNSLHFDGIHQDFVAPE